MNIEFSKSSILVNLIDLFDYVIGGDWGKDPDFNDDNYVLALCIRGSEFKNWNEDKGKTAALRKIKISSLVLRKLQEGDILIEISGGGPEQPVGRTVLIDKAVLSFKPDIPKICTNFLRLARPTININPKYLNYFLTFFYKSGDVVAYQGGSNNLRNLKFDDYSLIQVPLIPLPEQYRIVAKIEELFSRLDKGIESLKTARQQLKTYRQAVLKWAFEGRLTKSLNRDLSDYDDEHDTKTKTNHGNHTNHKNQGADNLPEGWVWKKLGEVCETTSGGTPSRKNPNYFNGNIPWVKSGELNNGIITKVDEYITDEALKNSNAKIFPKGTLLIALYGATIGKLGFLGIDAASNQAVCAIFLSKYINNKFLFHYLIFRKNDLIEQAIGGAQPNISQTILRDLNIPIPPLPEQHLIVSEIEKRLSVADKLEEAIATALQQAEALRQSILKKAFEGKLLSEAELQECRQDPAWEPASVLLERIASAKLSTRKAEMEKNKPAKSTKKSKQSIQS